VSGLGRTAFTLKSLAMPTSGRLPELGISRTCSGALSLRASRRYKLAWRGQTPLRNRRLNLPWDIRMLASFPAICTLTAILTVRSAGFAFLLIVSF
jgi:hypothetical protein